MYLKLNKSMPSIRTLAIYLPQFHPIPENNAAWGDGFTEWTNVKKAVPLFDGHYQPHVPHSDFGYYDLNDPEVLVKQAETAKKYGISGFAFYHYWFQGKRLLNLPLDNMLKSGKPDFPFCFIWANEDWTKRWNNQENEIIAKQNYSFEDDREHIRFLCENVFSDKRYITIDQKPVFLVYQTEVFPDIRETASIWREEVKKYGFKDIYLIRVERYASDVNILPESINFDAAMEFAPSIKEFGRQLNVTSPVNPYVHDYDETVLNTIVKSNPGYKLFRSVFPGWDNTPRKSNDPTLFVGSSAGVFEYFLLESIKYTRQNLAEDEQIIFINAWNEWGEGCHIEPDEKNAYAFLEGCKRAIERSSIQEPGQEDFDRFIKNIGSLVKAQKKRMQYLQSVKDEIEKSKSYRLGCFISSVLRFQFRRAFSYLKRK